MGDKSKSENKSHSRFVRNFAIAILVIVALMVCYFAMWRWKDFVFGTVNDLLGWVILLCLHPIMIVHALKEKKGQPIAGYESHTKGAKKPPSSETARDKEKRGKILQKAIFTIIQLMIIDIIAIIIFWILPTRLSRIYYTVALWIALLGAAGVAVYFVYSMSNRYGERRGLYSALRHLGIILLGWLLGRWMGLLFFSAPFLLLYYLVIYWYAIVIIPANDPDCKLVLFDKSNEKWQRFLVFVNYTWGIHYPMIVVEDEWGKETAPHILGSPFQPQGAPGIILTRSHQVVGITSGTDFSRVEGPGLVFTRRFERLLEIVDLRRQIRISQIEAMTKDGIKFNARLFMVFKVNDSSPDHTEGSFPYSRKWVRRLLKLTGVNPADQKASIHWDKMVVQQIEQTAQQILSQRTLNELWHPQDSVKYNSAFVETGDLIKLAVQSKLADMGITIITSRMPMFEFPEIPDNTKVSIPEQQLKTWRSGWARRADQTIAEGKAEAARLREEAHAFAQSILLKALAEGLRQTRPEISRYVIAIRFVSAIQELMKRDPALAEKVRVETGSQFQNIE